MHQVATQACNKTAHPGLADRAKTRRTRAEAEELHKNKAQAKAAREEARQESIRRTAAFEVQDKADEDFANATPPTSLHSKAGSTTSEPSLFWSQPTPSDERC